MSQDIITCLFFLLSSLSFFQLCISEPYPQIEADVADSDFGPILYHSENKFVFHLENKNPGFSFKCSSNRPVEWVTNFGFKTNRTTSVVQEVFYDSRLTTIKKYTATFGQKYTMSLDKESMVFCKHVHEMHTMKVVIIEPNLENNQIYINIYNNKTNYFNSVWLSSNTSCHIYVDLVKFTSKNYYTKCRYASEQMGMEMNDLQVQHDEGYLTCKRSSHSKIFLLPIQKQTCLNVLETDKESPNLEDWELIDYSKHAPGIRTCVNPKKEIVAAFPAFMTGFAEQDKRIGFYLENIRAEDIIAIDLGVSEVYAGDNLIISFRILWYFVARYPVYKIYLNNRFQRKEKFNGNGNSQNMTYMKTVSFKINLEGNYSISCSAVQEGSSTLTTLWKNFTALKAVPPYFLKATETLIFAKTDVYNEISCGALGRPEPFDFSWEFNPNPYTKVREKKVEFTSINEVITGKYTCTAKNRFGASASKIFIVSLSNDTTSTAWILPTIICASILLGVAIIVCTCTLVVVLYKRHNKARPVRLSQAQIDSFLYGDKSSILEAETDYLNINTVPYNKNYEILRDCIHYDGNKILGSGEYGVVTQGKVFRGGILVDVAIKTVKPGNPEYLQTLLTELKVLAHIGTQENIASLVGAWTKNLKKGQVYICTELCQASLLSYLNQHRNEFINLLDSTGSFVNNENCGPNTFSTIQLFFWAKQIANGMEYLEQKKIVHGDLAARNVLVSASLDAKICDFGLARQLIDYTYTKSRACPLPWKWMAIESLSCKEFSVKSDVWAFGVTLWEIFSLGDVPYVVVSWSDDFLNKLRSGYRLGHPAYATDNLYELMTRTWNESPKDRPTFKELKLNFFNLHDSLAGEYTF